MIELQVAAAKGTRSLAGERLALSSKRKDWLPDCGGEGSSPSRRQLWRARLGLGASKVFGIVILHWGGTEKARGQRLSPPILHSFRAVGCGDWSHGWLWPNYSQTSPSGSICRSHGDQHCGEWEGGPRSTGRDPTGCSCTDQGIWDLCCPL